MLDIFIIALVIAAVLLTNRSIARSRGLVHEAWFKRSLDRMFLYHCVFVFLFLMIPGDAIGYWNFGFQQIGVHSDKMKDYFGVGTIFLLWLDFLPSRIMGLSFFTGSFLYGTFGYLGLRYLFLLFVDNLKVNVKIFGVPVIPYMFYLPNLNFWTAGMGKDALCFFGIAWFLYSVVQYRKRFVSLLISFVLVYYIRPHVGMMIITGSAVAILFSREIKPFFKALFVLLCVGGFFFFYTKVANYLMISDLSVESLTGLAKDTASVLGTKTVGSAVDITSYPIPLRLFTYLYRPLFFDARNFVTLMSSVENLVYLLLTVKGIQSFAWRDVKGWPLWLKTGFIVFFLCMIIFANSLGNLGIIMREKNMSMIYWLMVCIWSIARRREEAIVARAAPSLNYSA